ncbi:MAG: cyclic nucleotide-binding domain-containing protein [Verrucomicrobiia bacterium]
MPEPSTSATVSATLARVHVFAGLDDSTLQLLSARAAVQSFPPGQWIAQQGELSSSFFCLLAGKVAVLRGTVILAELGPGECFGEMSMLECKPRSAGVRAAEPCQVASLKSTDLLAIYRERPDQYAIIILNLARDLARRLHRLDEAFAAITA